MKVHELLGIRRIQLMDIHVHVDFNVLKNAGQALEPSRTARGSIGEQQLKWMEF